MVASQMFVRLRTSSSVDEGRGDDDGLSKVHQWSINMYCTIDVSR